MRNKFLDFVIGFSCPAVLTDIFPPDYFLFTKLMDACLLIIVSTVSGILVAVFKDKLVGNIKERAKRPKKN